MRNFDAELAAALLVLEDDQVGNSADLQKIADKVSGNKEVKPNNTKNQAAAQKISQLDQQYQNAKKESQKADQDAAGKQDITKFNKATSVRKRLEDASKALELARQQAVGQTDPKKAEGMPQETAIDAMLTCSVQMAPIM